jgi:hypothetical protein
VATPTLPRAQTPDAAGAAGAAGPAPRREAAPPGGAPLASWTERLLGWLVLTLAAVGVLGFGPAVASLAVGRTALFWPSAQWLLVAGAGSLLGALLWAANARLRPAGESARERLRRAAWPALALLPGALAGIAIYRDETSHHFVANYPPSRESLLAYVVVVAAGAQVAYWLTALARRYPAAPGSPPDPALGPGLPPVFAAVAVAAYVNASLFQQWVPRQPDLLVNLRGARDLLSGILPYHDAVPVWADRVHLLPATLVLLFGPLAQLGDDPARLLFFLVNQLCWLAAMVILVRRLSPAGQQRAWFAALLVFGATYWPWQEAIRYGQQDGLLILLFVLSITAAGARREAVSGLTLGLALVVKPLSIWLPLVYLVHGRWRTLLVAGVTGAVLALATLPATGFDPWWHFVRVELPAMLPGTVRGTNIPLPSLHARMFVGREALGDGEAAPTMGVIGALNSAANLLGLLLVAHLALRQLKARRQPSGAPDATGDGDASGAAAPDDRRRRTWLLDAAIGLTLTLLLAPMAWQHYASWLVIAFFVLALPAVWRPLGPGARTGAAALAGCAFLLLSLEDSQLLRLLTPLVDRWPAVLAFYAAGLLAMAGALAVARFGAPAEP